MRGSLIQEIFRVVNEIHSSATRKNKEWQDKLPNVVLKAEEIMYSKANSEDNLDELVAVTDSRLKKVQKNLAILNKRTKGGCSCLCMLLSVIGIVVLVVAL